MQIADRVMRGEAWVAVVGQCICLVLCAKYWRWYPLFEVSSNATSALDEARQSGNVDYDPASAITVYYVSVSAIVRESVWHSQLSLLGSSRDRNGNIYPSCCPYAAPQHNGHICHEVCTSLPFVISFTKRHGKLNRIGCYNSCPADHFTWRKLEGCWFKWPKVSVVLKLWVVHLTKGKGARLASRDIRWANLYLHHCVSEPLHWLVFCQFTPVCSGTSLFVILTPLVLSSADLGQYTIKVLTHVREISHIKDRMTTSSFRNFCFFSPIIAYIPLSLNYALINLSFRLPFGEKWVHKTPPSPHPMLNVYAWLHRFPGVGGFFLFAIYTYLGMCALGLALEVVTLVLTLDYAIFFFVLWVSTRYVPGCYFDVALTHIWSLQSIWQPSFFCSSFNVLCFVMGSCSRSSEYPSP